MFLKNCPHRRQLDQLRPGTEDRDNQWFGWPPPLRAACLLQLAAKLGKFSDASAHAKNALIASITFACSDSVISGKTGIETTVCAAFSEFGRLPCAPGIPVKHFC